MTLLKKLDLYARQGLEMMGEIVRLLKEIKVLLKHERRP